MGTDWHLTGFPPPKPHTGGPTGWAYAAPLPRGFLGHPRGA